MTIATTNPGLPRYITSCIGLTLYECLQVTECYQKCVQVIMRSRAYLARCGPRNELGLIQGPLSATAAVTAADIGSVSSAFLILTCVMHSKLQMLM